MSKSELPITGLEGAIARRLVVELGPAVGERILRCLRTAESFLCSCEEDDQNLRYAESAAYNLREALDSVVQDKPAGEGGAAAAIDAWERYKVTSQLPGADKAAAQAKLAAVLDSLAADKERQAYMTRRLLAWFRKQTGVEPLLGDDDPTVQYQRLRDKAAQILHDDSTHTEVGQLFGETVAWFVRFFTPPSDLIDQITQLACRPYTSGLLSELRRLALNAHHVRLFLERVEDPAWLEPMRESSLIGLPQPGVSWPVAALTGSSRKLLDKDVAELLQRLLADVRSLPASERSTCALEIMRTASWLGPAGRDLVVEVLCWHPSDHWAQMIAISTTGEVDNNDPIHVRVADLVMGNESRGDRYNIKTLLERLVLGMTEDNVEERFGLIAIKIRRFAREDRASYLAIDIAALPIEGPDIDEPLLQAAQHLAAAVSIARTLGMSGTSMLGHVEAIPGEVGERLTCQVLAGATDINRERKLLHLVKRLGAATATGDDKALFDDLAPLNPTEIYQLNQAFGPPSPNPVNDAGAPFGENWPRGWRWSSVLPDEVLIGWEDAIAAVSEMSGTPDSAILEKRTPHTEANFGSSPHSTADIARLDALEAAAMIAAWRPKEDDPWGVSARGLARSLENAVTADTEPWVSDPVAIVRTLREPVYVDHYFRAVIACVPNLIDRASALLDAIELACRERWEPVVLGKDNYDYEPDWSIVDAASVDLVRVLADANADLAEDLPQCWQLTKRQIEALPDDLGTTDQYADITDFHDPLHGAINSTYGKGMQTALALGGWEYRKNGSASAQLTTTLTDAIAVTGAVGLQLRSVIAASLPFVETIASRWFADHHTSIFGGELGQVTFDQTLKYSQPTKAFYGRSLKQLLHAARRGADLAAAWLLIAYLWEEPEYTIERIINGLNNHNSAIAEVSKEIGRLAKDIPADQSHMLQRGVAFWKQLLTGDPHVPAAALPGLGGWALAQNLDQNTWLALTERTVDRTGGQIDLAPEVAERCREAQPSPPGLRILTALLGLGDRSEQHHVDNIAVDALRAATDTGLVDQSVDHLRQRLIQRGRHDAIS